MSELFSTSQIFSLLILFRSAQTVNLPDSFKLLWLQEATLSEAVLARFMDPVRDEESAFINFVDILEIQTIWIHCQTNNYFIIVDKSEVNSQEN